MLVLTRKQGQRIFIGDAIVIQVVQSRTGTARIGIVAPREMRIVREEITAAEGKEFRPIKAG